VDEHDHRLGIGGVLIAGGCVLRRGDVTQDRSGEADEDDDGERPDKKADTVGVFSAFMRPS